MIQRSLFYLIPALSMSAHLQSMDQYIIENMPPKESPLLRLEELARTENKKTAAKEIVPLLRELITEQKQHLSEAERVVLLIQLIQNALPSNKSVSATAQTT